MGSDVGGRTDIAAAMRLCPDVPLKSKADVLALRDYLASAWWALLTGCMWEAEDRSEVRMSQGRACIQQLACSSRLHCSCA